MLLNSTPSALLTTKNLAIGYNGVPILENINVNLFPKELVCFMGPNGIGKSSLIKTLAGLIKPVAGKYFFNEQAPFEKIISVVLTDRVTHPHLTVEDLVAIGRYPFLNWRIQLKEEDQSKIEQAIDHANIRHLRSRRIAELSDGQMQMVMIARALAQNTRVLLLDEPTAHLDLNNRVEIMNRLKSLSRETDRAVLIATHELDLALQTADRVWIASSDKTIKTGIPEDLVLDGSFDHVFQFKGYDLKTGKITHEEFRDRKVDVHGDGYPLLWTRNAVERNGYTLYKGANTIINVFLENNVVKWRYNNRQYLQLESLLTDLNSLNA